MSITTDTGYLPGILTNDGTYRCADHVDVSTYSRETHSGDTGAQCLYCKAPVGPAATDDVLADIQQAQDTVRALNVAAHGVAGQIVDAQRECDALDAQLEPLRKQERKYLDRAVKCVVGFHVQKNYALAAQVTERITPLQVRRDALTQRLEGLYAARAANGAEHERVLAHIRTLRERAAEHSRAAARPTRRAVVSLAVTEHVAVTGTGAGAHGTGPVQPQGVPQAPHGMHDLMMRLLETLGGSADEPDDVDAAYELARDVVTAQGGVPVYLPGDSVSHRSGLTTGVVTGYGARGEYTVRFHGAERDTVHAGRYLSARPVTSAQRVSVAVLRAAEQRMR